MGILKGTIQPTSQVDLPSGSVVKLLVFRIPNIPSFRRSGTMPASTSTSTLADLIGRTEISNPRQFPINFEIQYQDPQIPAAVDTPDFSVYITVYVEKGSHMIFSNENSSGSVDSVSKNRMHIGNEYGDLVGRNGRYRRHLDIFLNQILE